MKNLTAEPPYISPLTIRPIREEVDGDIVASYIARANVSEFVTHGVRINGHFALVDDHHKSTALYLLHKPLHLEILETTYDLLQYGKGASRYARNGGIDYLLKIIDVRFKDLSNPKYQVNQLSDIFVFLRKEDRYVRARDLTHERVLP